MMVAGKVPLQSGGKKGAVKQLLGYLQKMDADALRGAMQPAPMQRMDNEALAGLEFSEDDQSALEAMLAEAATEGLGQHYADKAETMMGAQDIRDAASRPPVQGAAPLPPAQGKEDRIAQILGRRRN